MNPLQSLLAGADKLINGELPIAPKTANSTPALAFKPTPVDQILNPKPKPAPKPSIYTTKTPEQQVAEINLGIKTGAIKTPATNIQKTPGFSSGIPVLRGGEIKQATGKEVKPTQAGNFLSDLFGEASKIVGGDTFARAEARDISQRTGLNQPFLQSIRDEGLLPSLGKTESEKIQARYDALFESGINSDRAKQIAEADVLKNKINYTDPKSYQENRTRYDSLAITPEEEKAMRWTKVWEVAQLGLDTIGNFPALGSLKFLRNTARVVAETDDVAKITKELLETGMPENVATRVAPDFVKITDEKKVAQKIEDIATALRANPKVYGDKVVKQYPETVTQIASLKDPKAIEEILFNSTGVDKNQIPAMAKVLSQTDNPKRVTNIIEGFTKVPEKKVVANAVKNLEYNTTTNNLIESYAKGEEKVKQLEDLQAKIDAMENPKKFDELSKLISEEEVANKSVVKQLAQHHNISEYEAIDSLSTYIDSGKRRGARTTKDFYNFLPERTELPTPNVKKKFEKGDLVRLTDKETGKTQTRVITGIKEDGYVVMPENGAGIPNKLTTEKWDVEVIGKKEIPKRGPTFKDLDNMETLGLDTEDQAKIYFDARNYKTADEFIKAQGDSFFHTTPSKFDKFDKKFLGKNTDFPNAKQGFFFTDNADQIEDFKNVLQTGFGGDFVNAGRTKTAEELAKYRTIEKIGKKENFFNFNYNARNLTGKEARDFADFAEQKMGGLYNPDGEIVNASEMSDAELVKFLHDNVFVEDLDPDMSFLPNFLENHFEDFVKFTEEKGYKGLISDYGGGKDEYLIFDPNVLPDRQKLVDIWEKSNDVGAKVADKVNIPTPKFEEYGIYSVADQEARYNQFIKPQLENLGKVKPDETIIYYNGDGTPGQQYVNTKLREVFTYPVDENLKVVKVKKSQLKPTGTPDKDAIGYRILGEKTKSPLEIVSSKPTPPKVTTLEEKIAKIDEEEFYISMSLENEKQALDRLREDLFGIDLEAYKRLDYRGADLASGASKTKNTKAFNKVARQLEDFANQKFGGMRGNGGIDEARDIVDNYISRERAFRKDRNAFKDQLAEMTAEKKALQKQVKEIQKAEVVAVESEIAQEKFLTQQAQKTEKMIQEEKIAKLKAEQRAIKNEEITKKLEETQKKLIEEKAYKQRYAELVQMAKRPEFTNNKIGNRLRYAFRKTLFPIKNLDEGTQTIFRDWKRQILVTRELAQEQFLKLGIPKEQGMKIINEYQAGIKNEFTDLIKKTFDELFKQAKLKGFDFRYWDNYLPQVYKETPEEIREKLQKYFADKGLDAKMIEDYLDGVAELPEEVAKTLKINPSFEKERTFPNYEVAKQYGLTPRYENPAQLASHYKEQMEIALANRNFIKKLEEAGKVLPEADAPRTWQEIKLQLEGNRYFARPDFAEIINGQMRDPDKLGLFDLAVKGVAKTSKLMQEIALSAGVPKTSFNFFTIGQVVKAITSGDIKMAGEVMLRSNFNKASIKFFQDNADVIKEMASEGVDVSRRMGVYQDMYETLADKLAKKEFKNAIGLGFADLFNTKTFSSFMPQMQISNYKQVYKKAIADGLSPEEARKFSADVTRKFFGLFEDVGRSDSTNDGLTALFFAPRFREGMINVLMNNLKSVTSEFRNPIYYKNRRLVLGMALTYASYNAINKQLNGNYMWENEPGKEFALKMPYGEGKFVYLEFMPSFLAFARSLASGFYNLATGNTGVATQKLGSIFSMPIKTTTDIISNSDYFDRPIYKESDEGTVKAQKIAKYAGLSFAHPYVKETLKQIDEKNKVPLWQSLSIAMELPLKYSTQQKINTAKYFENLNSYNKENAQRKDANQKEFQPLFDKVQKLKEEGKIEEAKAIVDGLSDYEYEFYKTMLKSTKAKATNQNKIDFLPTYEQVQKLKEQGRIDEASEIVDSLSDEDYKAYTALKKSFSTKPEISVSDN